MNSKLHPCTNNEQPTPERVRRRRPGLFCFMCVMLSLIGLLLLAMQNGAQAQEPTAVTYEGTEFWITFPMNFRDFTRYPHDVPDSIPSEPLSLRIVVSASGPVKGVASIEGIGYRKEFSLSMKGSIELEVPKEAQADQYSIIMNKGLHVTTDSPVTVVATSHRFQTTDSYTCLPVTSLGSLYRAMGYKWLSNDLLSQVTIVATEPHTMIEFAPTSAIGTDRSTAPFTVELNAGDVYQVRPIFEAKKASDLTGSLITSSAPIAVFSGHNCAYVPDIREKACNVLVEQMPPVSTWGNDFIVSAIAYRSAYTVRVMASEDGTTVMQDGKKIGTINAGQFLEQQRLYSDVHLSSDKPVLVSQFTHGFATVNPKTGNADSTGDPMMIVIEPVTAYSRALRFSTTFQGEWHHMVNIVAPAASTSGIMIEDDPVDPRVFRAVPGTSFSVASLELVPGTYTIRAPVPIGAICYGHGYGTFIYDAYGSTAAHLSEDGMIIPAIDFLLSNSGTGGADASSEESKKNEPEVKVNDVAKPLSGKYWINLE